MMSNVNVKTEFVLNETQLEEEFQDLLKTYKFKGYRRYGNILKAKYDRNWKKDTTISEFVWNYCKTPSAANRLIELLCYETLDDQHIKKWLTNINLEIDADITFCDFQDAIQNLKSSIDRDDHVEEYVHVLGEGPDLESERPETFVVDGTEGDLFHGIIFDGQDYDSINNVRFVFDSPSGEYTYIFQKEDFENNTYVLGDSDEIFYVPLFQHPIPLVHLLENRVKLSIQVIMEPGEEQIDCRPLLTVMSPRFQQWFKERSLLLVLRDGDVLRVGPKKMRIIGK